jgi:hypothetical protein
LLSFSVALEVRELERYSPAGLCQRFCLPPTGFAPGLEENVHMSSMDRRSLLTAMLGACVAASAVGALAGPAAALPRAAAPKVEPETADASPEVGEGEAKVHNAQYIVIRRRPRRRWIWRRPRRRRVYFY